MALYSSRPCKQDKPIATAGWHLNVYDSAQLNAMAAKEKCAPVCIYKAKKERQFVAFRACWVIFRFSAAILPMGIYCLDALNQFSMCQAPPNWARMGQSLQNIGCFRHEGRRASYGSSLQASECWQHALNRWQHVAKLQHCQTMNVSVIIIVPRSMHQSWVNEKIILAQT